MFVQSTLSSASLHLTKQQRMGWVEDLRNVSFLHILYHFHYSLLSVSYIHRSEFPGLKASPNWVLCDAAGGTQVHPEPLPPIFFRPIKDFSGPSKIFQAHRCVLFSGPKK